MDEQNRRQCPVPATYKYIIYQQEMCPSTGRLHYQGFVYFTNPRSFDSVRREFGGMTHVEVCHDITASIAYCSKEDTRVGTTFEDAIKPECARPKGWWQQISIAQLWEEEPDWMLRHHAAVTAYHKQIKKVSFVRPKPQVIVLWGPPGTGKSHTARAICDNFYVKPTGNWWDGYYGQDLVIFDDFYGTEKYCDMLRWLSENPIKVPIKGSMTDLLATKFVITSNVEPQRWYPHVENTDALMRRITDTIYMDKVYVPSETHATTSRHQSLTAAKKKHASEPPSKMAKNQNAQDPKAGGNKLVLHNYGRKSQSGC